MSESYRLTFNKPAVSNLLQTDSGEAANGLRVRIENGVASFMPVRDSNDDDVVRLEGRSRGGVEATIEGSMADELKDALDNEAGPFFTIKRIGAGWMGVNPHPHAEAPSKFTPHVRVWHSGVVRPRAARGTAKAAKAAPKTVSMPVASTSLNVPAMFEQLRKAKTTLAAFSTEKRRGQPPREVREAREALAAFSRNAVEFLPEIAQAHSILHGIVAQSGTDIEMKPRRAKAEAPAPRRQMAARRKSQPQAAAAMA